MGWLWIVYRTSATSTPSEFSIGDSVFIKQKWVMIKETIKAGFDDSTIAVISLIISTFLAWRWRLNLLEWRWRPNLLERCLEVNDHVIAHIYSWCEKEPNTDIGTSILLHLEIFSIDKELFNHTSKKKKEKKSKQTMVIIETSAPWAVDVIAWLGLPIWINPALWLSHFLLFFFSFKSLSLSCLLCN